MYAEVNFISNYSGGGNVGWKNSSNVEAVPYLWSNVIASQAFGNKHVLVLESNPSWYTNHVAPYVPGTVFESVEAFLSVVILSENNTKLDWFNVLHNFVGNNANIATLMGYNYFADERVNIDTTNDRITFAKTNKTNLYDKFVPVYGLHSHVFSATEKVAKWLLASRDNTKSYYALQESQSGCKMLNPGMAISKSTGNTNLPYLISQDLGIWEPQLAIKDFMAIKYPIYGFTAKPGTTTKSTTMTNIIKTFDPSFVLGGGGHLVNMTKVALAADNMIDAFDSSLNFTVADLKLEFPTINNRMLADLTISTYLFGTANPGYGGLFISDNWGEGTSKIHSYSSNIINSAGVNIIGNYGDHQLIQTKDFSSVLLAEAAADSIQANPPTSSWVVAIDEKQFDQAGTLIPNKFTLILVQCATTLPELDLSISDTGLRGVIQDPNDYYTLDLQDTKLANTLYYLENFLNMTVTKTTTATDLSLNNANNTSYQLLKMVATEAGKLATETQFTSAKDTSLAIVDVSYISDGSYNHESYGGAFPSSIMKAQYLLPYQDNLDTVAGFAWLLDTSSNIAQDIGDNDPVVQAGYRSVEVITATQAIADNLVLYKLG